MNKENKSDTSKQEIESKALCDGCGFSFNQQSLIKNGNGKSYCTDCNSMNNKAKSIEGKISLADIDRMLKILLNTSPPKKDKDEKKREKQPSSTT